MDGVPTPPRPRRAWRWLRRGALAGALLCAALFLAGELYAARDAERALLAGRQALAGSSAVEVDGKGRGRTWDVELEGERGLLVRARLRLPPGPGPHPVVVVLGGQRTGRAVVDLIGDAHAVGLLGLDYPYEKPEPRPVGLAANVAEGLRIHDAVFDVVPAVLLAVDWLEAHEAVDAGRIVLVGGSLGALFAPAIAALEPRVAALGLLLGAGDLGGLVAANLEAPFPLPQVAGWAASSLVAPLEPLVHVGAVAPRPVLVVAGEGDERMPRALAEKLVARCGEPLEVRWLDLGHVDVRDPEFHTQVLGEVVTWFAEIGVLGR